MTCEGCGTEYPDGLGMCPYCYRPAPSSTDLPASGAGSPVRDARSWLDAARPAWLDDPDSVWPPRPAQTTSDSSGPARTSSLPRVNPWLDAFPDESETAPLPSNPWTEFSDGVTDQQPTPAPTPATRALPPQPMSTDDLTWKHVFGSGIPTTPARAEEPAPFPDPPAKPAPSISHYEPFIPFYPDLPADVTVHHDVDVPEQITPPRAAAETPMSQAVRDVWASHPAASPQSSTHPVFPPLPVPSQPPSVSYPDLPIPSASASPLPASPALPIPEVSPAPILPAPRAYPASPVPPAPVAPAPHRAAINVGEVEVNPSTDPDTAATARTWEPLPAATLPTDMFVPPAPRKEFDTDDILVPEPDDTVIAATPQERKAAARAQHRETRNLQIMLVIGTLLIAAIVITIALTMWA